MEQQRFTRYGEKKAGTNNKFYEVEAVELEDGRGQWIFRWGRIGTTGQSKEGTSYSFDDARRKCEEQFGSKEKRGYREANAMEALASAVQDLHERPTRGLEPVALKIPNFHAGASEKRCRDFCQKWLDKLNLIRRSKRDLGSEYEKQMDSVFAGYRDEWYRIRRTKSHGHLSENDEARAAFEEFYMLLVRNTGLNYYAFPRPF